MKLFRYIGSKYRLAECYKKPPIDTKRIVEVFAGSMCYAMTYCDKYETLGIELNPRVYNVYNWLLNKPNLYETLEKFNKYMGQHFDIRESNEFSEAEKDYIRLNCGSIFTGNIGKHIIYTKEKPIEPCLTATKHLLKKAKHIEVKLGSCFELYKSEDVKQGDLVFIDPPYETSTETYNVKESQTEKIKEYINSLIKTGVPIIFTYGQDAPKLYPEYNWEYVKKQHVITMGRDGNARKLVVRDEWVCYFNFENKQFSEYKTDLFD